MEGYLSEMWLISPQSPLNMWLYCTCWCRMPMLFVIIPSLLVKRPQTRQHSLAPRHHSHARVSHLCLWVHGESKTLAVAFQDYFVFGLFLSVWPISHLSLSLLQQTDLAQYMIQHPGGLHSYNIRVNKPVNAHKHNGGRNNELSFSHSVCLFSSSCFSCCEDCLTFTAEESCIETSNLRICSSAIWENSN